MSKNFKPFTDNLNLNKINISSIINNVIYILKGNPKIKKSAFTLAEVLITLGIIGVVAALTLPTLIHKYNMFVLQNQFKKAYSVLTNAHQQMLSDGIDVYKDFCYPSVDGRYRSVDQQNQQLETFVKYLKDAKICEDIYSKCVNGGPSYKALGGIKGAHINPDAYTKRTIVLPEMTIWLGDTIWAKTRYYVDINGTGRKPNRLGYDLFTFTISSDNKIVPDSNVNNCKFSNTGNYNTDAYDGFGCTLYALTDQNPTDKSLSYWQSFLKK